MAVNDALDAPEATDTVAGTVTAPLLLEMATVTPPDGAATLKVTAHAVVPEPVSKLLEHDKAVTVGVTFGVSGAINEIDTDFTVAPCDARIVAV